MNRAWSGVIAAIATIGLLACGGGGPAGGGPPPPPPPPPPMADVTIDMDAEAYIDPEGRRNSNAFVEIAVGETVAWTNSDNVEHTVTSGVGPNGSQGSGVPPGADALASGILLPGSNFVHTFNIAGIYTYYCEVHPNTMFNATIVVQ